MAAERISKIAETRGGSFVFAQADRATGARTVVCSGCQAYERKTFRSDAGAIITVAEHSEFAVH